jgi:hypothetical protein
MDLLASNWRAVLFTLLETCCLILFERSTIYLDLTSSCYEISCHFVYWIGLLPMVNVCNADSSNVEASVGSNPFVNI